MRTAVVTGAARGLGRAISERLVADGFAVWALDTDEAEVGRMADEVGATACAIDVTDEAAVDDLAARLGRCDALVNNAAIWRYTPLAETPIDEARRVLAVNVLGPLLLMQRLVPVMARSEGAAIVNISSITAKYSPTGAGIYPASKAALEALARVWANETASTPLRVNLFNPGPIRTRMRAAVFPGEDPMTLDTPEQAAEFIVPMCLPSWNETGKFYDYKTRTLMSFHAPG